MSKIRVAVLRGGPGHEYEVSLKTGAGVLSALRNDKYEPKDVLITKDGEWLLSGIPIEPQDLKDQVDVAFNALHGEFGEDGLLQDILDEIDLPYTGSGAEASRKSINKDLAKTIFKEAGLLSPYGLVFDLLTMTPKDVAFSAFNRIPSPWIVKPVDKGSSVGTYFARNFDELLEGVTSTARFANQILIEEYIKGEEATCGVIDNFRREALYSLPPIEIRRPVGKLVWDYTDKYSGETKEICPGNFKKTDSDNIEQASKLIHQILGLRHYSRSDFILSPRGLYVLEVNTLPGLTPTSLLPKSLEAVGASYDGFIDHLISLALSSQVSYDKTT